MFNDPITPPKLSANHYCQSCLVGNMGINHRFCKPRKEFSVFSFQFSVKSLSEYFSVLSCSDSLFYPYARPIIR